MTRALMTEQDAAFERTMAAQMFRRMYETVDGKPSLPTEPIDLGKFRDQRRQGLKEGLRDENRRPPAPGRRRLHG